MGLILRNNTIVKNLRVGPLSGGGGNGGDGGGSLYSSNVLFHYDIGDTNSYPGTGTTINDLSGNGHDLNITTLGTYTSAGTSSYLADSRVVSSPAIPNLLNEAQQDASFTYSIWYNRNGDNYGWDSLFGFRAQMPGYSPFYLRVEGSTSNDRLAITHLFTDGQNDSQQSPQNSYVSSFSSFAPENVWNNICVVTDGLTILTYVNGQEISSNTFTLAQHNVRPILAGNSTDPVTYMVDTGGSNGFFGQSIFYNEALTATQVLGNYNALKSRYGY